MTELLTAAEMRDIEKAAMASGSVTGLELMERAGNGVVDAVLKEWPTLSEGARRAIVLCGPGNNGGDGYVVARLLKSRGWGIEVYQYGEPENLPPDARENYERWRALGDVRPLEEFPDDAASAPGDLRDLVIDAMFGTGLTRPMPRDVQRACWAVGMGYGAFHTVAVDIPSGLSSDTGEVFFDEAEPSADDLIAGRVCPAHLTVTFHARKLGHALGKGGRYCGALLVADIGVGGWGRVARNPARLVTRAANSLSKASGHKYQSGHALILSGGSGKTGAARLAARGALRIGAGLVSVGCPHAALDEVAAQTTAVMCRVIDGAPDLREALEDKRLNSLCLGPGMGVAAEAQAMVLAALGDMTMDARPVVLDADALTLFKSAPEVLFDALHKRCVLTPHEGEFRRLFPDIAEKIGVLYSKVDAARNAAARAGCTVLFKGPDTVVADHTGRAVVNASVNERAVPWLATAGAGDVLAGFITGLLSRGFSTFDAASTGAWLHTECALSFGPGLIAEDLPEELPRVFRELGF